jgi:hypothetical protein
MRANAWEGIGKELIIKRKFYVRSRDVRIVCPRLKPAIAITDSSDVATHTTYTFRFVLPSECYKHTRLDDRQQSALHTVERLVT